MQWPWSSNAEPIRLPLLYIGRGDSGVTDATGCGSLYTAVFGYVAKSGPNRAHADLSRWYLTSANAYSAQLGCT
jgi:hypothetical protein